MTAESDVESDIVRFYGSSRSPNYSKVLPKFEAGLDQILLDKITDKYWIKDVTDPNLDCAFFVNLLSEKEQLLLIYSFVTEGFHIVQFEPTRYFDSKQDYSTFCNLNEQDELPKYCLSVLGDKARYLAKDELVRPIEFAWGGAHQASVPLYKVLFLQDGELPYFGT